MSALRLEAAAGSHVGCVRGKNEDSYATLPEVGAFVVADGMGGKPGGEIASRMAVDLVRGCLDRDDPEETWPCGLSGKATDRDEARLILGVRAANRAIFELGRRELSLRGMGTTFAGMLVSGDGATLAHVGDSRIYRFRHGKLEQLTRDHTVIEMARHLRVELDASEDLIPDALVRAVGTERTVDVETRRERIERGDTFLLCSDGLWGPVPKEDIAATLAWRSRPEAIVARLIGRAIERGGPDNVTCVVVRFGGE
jgi:serine/threonine protein phosphatase PrpC